MFLVEPWLFMLLIFAGSFAAGLLGSLTGLGGGVVIIPLLVLVFGVDLRFAIGASLVGVIATSSGAAVAFIREGFTNIRVAMFLEIATTLGAILGAWIAGMLDTTVIALLFCAVLFWSAWSSARSANHLEVRDDAPPDEFSTRWALDGVYPTKDGPKPYRVRHARSALGVMLGAGVLSALVGVGSGVVKVVAMDRLMRLPFKVSTTTSNFMIGVTSAASAGVYLQRGQLEPTLCAPVAVGAVFGALLGSRILPKAKTRTLRVIFALVVAGAGVQLLFRTLTGKM